MRCPVLPWDRKGARCLMCRLAFPEIAKAHAASISLKEDEMRAMPCINKCSTRCAVGYRIRICFEYQSMPLLE